ncbi:MAG: DUF6318 family protein [Kineosporiaceae bacterium]
MIVALAGSTLLGGCSGGKDEPSAWPTLSNTVTSDPTTPTASPSTPPLPPVKPEAAYPSTPEGAQEFVRWYLKAYEYAYASGDPTPIMGVATRGCVQCQSIVDRVSKRRAASQRLLGQRITVTGAAVAPGASAKHTVVLATFDSTGSTLVDAAGKTLDTFSPVKNEQLLIGLTWDIVAGWRVVDGRFDGGTK